ncbi:hypothetical protein C8Q80DRAFT_421835 [Daedaleopsis nitida]|nr:hypothetical protein C8Q80DRAFT_421835 [Daedaleopsis nitida]
MSPGCGLGVEARGPRRRLRLGCEFERRCHGCVLVPVSAISRLALLLLFSFRLRLRIFLLHLHLHSLALGSSRGRRAQTAFGLSLSSLESVSPSVRIRIRIRIHIYSHARVRLRTHRSSSTYPVSSSMTSSLHLCTSAPLHCTPAPPPPSVGPKCRAQEGLLPAACGNLPPLPVPSAIRNDTPAMYRCYPRTWTAHFVRRRRRTSDMLPSPHQCV